MDFLIVSFLLDFVVGFKVLSMILIGFVNKDLYKLLVLDFLVII